MPKSIAAIPALAACLWASEAMAEPLFPNSVVSNDIEFIAADDPAVFGCLRTLGQATQEMPGALDTDELMVEGVHTFAVAFADDTEVGVWVHPSVGTQADAEAVAALLVGPIGRLPAVMRRTLSHVVIHSGDHTAFGEHLGHFFVVYADNVRARIATHDLEETVFHEAVHATLDAAWAQSEEWRQAQAADGAFITEYAAADPEGEDLAESALFAYAHLRHPDRLPPEVARGVEAIMPARLAFFERLFAAPEPDVAGAERLAGVGCASAHHSAPGPLVR
ncbi:hypothetical protein FHG66_14680 [Rubellimicrobium rubrum]|uniref:DUF1570 domain-containing protein n=1 Tax=Rubellimicrobium rubrum TaxID=2585369 RepID=A0A5C4MR13_9RHOB|nr:hypothetical protein [Rubellimicrobium rubrum]TNC48360.1 hypothetical protein FHG66_14680 [Rubellimicrobium rubrum]